MAYLNTDDKQQGQQGQDSGTQTMPNTQAGSGSGGFVGSAVSTNPGSGQGTGGSGSFTNIQDYLTANQGSTGSADYLKSQVGNEFNQEQKSLDDQTSQAKQQAQSASSGAMNQDQASKLVGQAAGQYNYNGNQPQSYADSINSVRSYLTSPYSGPSSFNYGGIGGQAQSDGTNLQSSAGFNALMEGLYNRSSGGTIGSGGMALQQQLDQGNPALNQARQDLTNQYSTLTNNVNSGVSSTNQALQGAQKAYQSGQGSLRDYLMGQANTTQGRGDYNTYNALADVLGLSHMSQGQAPAPLDNNDAGPKTFGGVLDSPQAPSAPEAAPALKPRLYTYM